MSTIGSSLATIEVTFSVAGMHYWPGATGVRSYLAVPHRHRFGVSVSMQVDHDEREVEFHDLIVEARSLVMLMGRADDGMVHFGGMSCETLARRLAVELASRYSRSTTVRVSEDGECSATVNAGPVDGPGALPDPV